MPSQNVKKKTFKFEEQSARWNIIIQPERENILVTATHSHHSAKELRSLPSYVLVIWC